MVIIIIVFIITYHPFEIPRARYHPTLQTLCPLISNEVTVFFPSWYVLSANAFKRNCRWSSWVKSQNTLRHCKISSAVNFERQLNFLQQPRDNVFTTDCFDSARCLLTFLFFLNWFYKQIYDQILVKLFTTQERFSKITSQERIGFLALIICFAH